MNPRVSQTSNKTIYEKHIVVYGGETLSPDITPTQQTNYSSDTKPTLMGILQAEKTQIKINFFAPPDEVRINGQESCGYKAYPIDQRLVFFDFILGNPVNPAMVTMIWRQGGITHVKQRFLTEPTQSVYWGNVDAP